ncbi:hypothetical protein RB195_016512 [Necator americanus]|uniref:Uncharacterized protein n=1 Tax=Necator americanus TaxID=51031 RepID=A0ABR1C1Z4_NECAM
MGGARKGFAPGRTVLSSMLPKSKKDYSDDRYLQRTYYCVRSALIWLCKLRRLSTALSNTKTRRRHPLNAVYKTGEELFTATCDNRGVGEVEVLVNMSMTKKIDSFEQLTTRIGRLRMRRCGATPALNIFIGEVYVTKLATSLNKINQRFFLMDVTFVPKICTE